MSASPMEWGAAATAAPRIAATANSGFPDHRKAALALLKDHNELSHKEAGFLGHVCVASELSDRQHDWLLKLLARHDTPPLASGGGE